MIWRMIINPLNIALGYRVERAIKFNVANYIKPNKWCWRLTLNVNTRLPKNTKRQHYLKVLVVKKQQD